MTSNGQRVLVTGGFGYVGGRVAQALAHAGHQVRLGSRSKRDVPDWLPEATCVETGWDSSGKLVPACEGIDLVVHAAAMNEIDAAQDPAGALQMNGVATVRLLEAAVKTGVNRFIYFSTAHVYGSPLQGTLDERCLPRPVHPYATSHKAAEDAVLATFDQGRLDGIVVRLSNSFGAAAHAGIDRWTLLVNDLCRQAVTDRTLTLKSGGLQKRDFVTLLDVGRAICHLANIDAAALGDGLFNLGGEWSPSIFEMAQLVAEQYKFAFGKEISIKRPTPTEHDIETLSKRSLDFRIDRLKRTGFELVGDREAEIIAMLKLCSNAFEVA